MEKTEHKDLFEFLDIKFGGIDRDYDGTAVDPVRKKLRNNIIPISLLVLAVFMPRAGGYAFLGLYLAFQLGLLLIDYVKPEPDLAIWTTEENETLYRYYLALRHPAAARAASRQLNAFRWIGLVLLTPVLLWNHMWVAAGLTVASFFNPLTSSLVVRLDPSHFLGDAVRRGKTQFEPDLYKLMHVSQKYDESLHAPTSAPTLEDALAAHGRGDYGAALQALRPLAEQGSGEARSLLGGMYYEGQGVPKDYKEAARLYGKAAEQGLAGAQKRLGDLYYRGHGVPKDRDLAAKWYRKSAEQGDADAQFCLGGIFFDQQAKALLNGGQQDISKPVKWYLMAAEQGHREAQYSLGVLYSGDMFGALDYVQAYKWLDLAASEKSVKGRDSIAGMMTPEQVAEAKRLAGEWRPAQAARHGQPSPAQTAHKDRGMNIKRMNKLAKAGIVLGCYTAALAVAYILVDIRQAHTSGPDAQASAGMYAFGDLVLFVGSFCILAVIPTFLAYYFMRPDAKLWKVLARISNFRF